MMDATKIILTAEDRTRAAFESAKSNLGGLASVAGKLNGVLGAVGLGAGLGGLAAMIKSSIDAADNMRDLAISTGTSVEALASLELAAKQSGTSIDAVGAAMGKLSIFMAKNGAEAQALGLTARDPAKAFVQLADVLSKVEDPAQRNALALRILGRGYAEVIPLLAQGGDELRKQTEAAGPYAERMAKLAETADQFNDSLAAIGQSAQAAMLPLAQSLATVFNNAIQAGEGLKGLDAVLAGMGQAGVIGQTVAVVWANVAYVFDQVGNEIGGIAAQIAAIASGDFKGAGAIGRAMEEDAKIARKELDALEDRILNFKAKAQAGGGKKAAGGLNVGEFIEGGEVDKLQKTLEKAFSTKPMDDLIAKLPAKRQQIVAEYARLKADLAGVDPSKATGGDIANELAGGRGALARGDAVNAGIAADRAKEMLKNLRDNGGISYEISYYSREVEAYELAMVDAQERVAIQGRDAMQERMQEAADIVAGLDPLVVPVDGDALVERIRSAIDTFRRELEANPLVVPVVAGQGIGVAGKGLSNASLKLGAR